MPRWPGSAVERFFSHVRKTDGCWFWIGANNETYGLFWWSEYKRKVGAHCASHMLFLGPVPDGLDVCHSCDTPLCVNPAHLFIGTRRQNILDAGAKNRMYRPDTNGTKNVNAKLNPDLVREVRAAVASGTTRTAVAKHYSVALNTVSNIAARRTWRTVE